MPVMQCVPQCQPVCQPACLQQQPIFMQPPPMMGCLPPIPPPIPPPMYQPFYQPPPIVPLYNQPIPPPPMPFYGAPGLGRCACSPGYLPCGGICCLRRRNVRPAASIEVVTATPSENSRISLDEPVKPANNATEARATQISSKNETVTSKP